MKKISLLCFLLLLVLTGCRSASHQESTPPQVTPLVTQPPAKPSQEPTASPAVTPAPAPTPAPTPAALPKAEVRKLALAWCQENQRQFANADNYAADRSLWFADYAPGVTIVPFEQGNVYFHEDTTGALPVAEVVATLAAKAGEVGEAFSVVAPFDWLQETQQIAAVVAAQATTREGLNAALSAQLHYPGLGEEMWLCGNVLDGDEDFYVMMKQGNLYRLQRDTAFSAYAESPQIQVRLDYPKAVQAYSWFNGGAMPSVSNGAREYDGMVYFKINYLGISSLADLRFYLKDFFSDEIVDTLLPAGQSRYRDFDGELYAYSDVRAQAETQAVYQVVTESENRILYHAEVDVLAPGDPPTVAEHKSFDFPYEKVNDQWIFTDFSLVW